MNSDYYKNDFFKNPDSEDTGDNILNKYKLWDSFKRNCPINTEYNDFFCKSQPRESRGLFQTYSRI